MKTTLKRGIGRAGVNGNGRSILPPDVRTPMRRYRQPDPPRRGAWHLVRLAFGWTIVAALVVAGGAAGAAYIKADEFKRAIAPKSKTDKEAARHTDPVIPGHATTALLIGTDRRKGSDARFTGPVGRSDTLMLLRADPQTNTISMLSFPRDLVVPIHCPGHAVYDDRINAAFATCGSLGSVETVRALTGVHINYFITVNFHGFLQLVDNLGGVWLDVDHRYFNNQTGPGGYSAINLWPGYQRLNGSNALAYVRYRHFDSDLFRVQRQQLFLKAVKEQVQSQMSLGTVLDVVDAVEKSVVIGPTPGLNTIYGYVKFARDLPAGHIFQTHIEGLTGYAELTTAPSNIAAAISQFEHPDVSAPAQARNALLGIKTKTPRVPPPQATTVTVLNGNGVQGSAANAAYNLSHQGYKIILPPSQKPGNAPSFNYQKTTIYYDSSQKGAQAAASKLGTLFSGSEVKMTNIQIAALANGAMDTIVIGTDDPQGLITPPPPPTVVQRQPPAVSADPAMSLPYVRAARRHLHFRVELPHLVASGSEPEPLAPWRVYPITKGHPALRLTYELSPTDFWGIEETDYNDAPALSSPTFEHRIHGRVFDLFYSGAHLHMVVLKENGATYWVINTIQDTLSNETMLAIAKGLHPFGK